MNFHLRSYLDVNRQERKVYELTRDGFSFLVNKMSGPEAAEFTEKFIGAFNAPSNLTTSIFRWLNIWIKKTNAEAFSLMC